MRGKSYASGTGAYEGNVKQRPLTPSRASNTSTNDAESSRYSTSRDERKRSGGTSRSFTPARDENADSGYSTSHPVATSVDQRRPRSRTRSSSTREKSKVVTQNAATDNAEHQARSYYSAVSRRLSCSSERKEYASPEGDHLAGRTSFVPVFAISSSAELMADRAGTPSSAATAAEKDSKLHRRPSWGRSGKKEHVTEESGSRLSKRASRLGLPELEKDLLPSLNDTVERMTHGISRVDSRSDHSSLERASSRENHRHGWNAMQQESRFSPSFQGASPGTTVYLLF